MKLPINDDVEPTHTPRGVDREYQRKTLRRLRELENQGRQARFSRDDLILANSLSRSLSRPDMARAIDVSPGRVDQIIVQHSTMLQDQTNAAAAELNAKRRGLIQAARAAEVRDFLDGSQITWVKVVDGGEGLHLRVNSQRETLEICWPGGLLGVSDVTAFYDY